MTLQSMVEAVIADRRGEGTPPPRSVQTHGVFPDQSATTCFVRSQLLAVLMRGVTPTCT